MNKDVFGTSFNDLKLKVQNLEWLLLHKSNSTEKQPK